MPALTKEQEENFKKAYQKSAIPQSKADVQVSEKPPYSDVNIPEEFSKPMSFFTGAGNTMDVGSSIGPRIIEYLYNKKTGLDMPKEQAKQMSEKIFNEAYEQNPVSYMAGRGLGEIGSGSGIVSGAEKIVQGAQNFPKIAGVVKKIAEPGLFGATSGATTAMRGGDTEDIATNTLLGGLGSAVVPKIVEGITKFPGAVRDTAKSATRFFTGTSKEIGDFIDKNPQLAKQITQKGFPSSEELIKETIQQKKPILEQMTIFKDAEKMKNEAINHLLENDFKYDPLHVANLIDEKIKDTPIASKLTEKMKSELKGHVNFYKNAFKDEGGNIIPMDGIQTARMIKDFQTLADDAYKEGKSKEITKIYRNIAAQIRQDAINEVPKFGEFMDKSERLVNKGLFIKKKIAEPKQGINWQNATEQEIIGAPISEQKLQSTIFDRKRGQVGTGMMRDRDLMRLNQVMPQGGRITPEDLLRVQGKKLMENPKTLSQGSAPMLTGAPFGMGVSALLHSQGMPYMPATALGTIFGTYAGQKIRQEGQSVATSAYMNIKKAEDATRKFKDTSKNLIDKFIGTKYQKLLQDAAMKGTKSFASTIMTLKTNDNDFRQQYNEMQGLDK